MRPSVAELNEEIRSLWSHPSVPLNGEQRERYQRLLAALREAEREEIVEAA